MSAAWIGHRLAALATVVALLAGSSSIAAADPTPSGTPSSGTASSGTASPGASQQPGTNGQSAGTVSVASVTPVSPAETPAETVVTVTLTVTNNSAQMLSGLRIDALREAPIVQQSQLDAVLANPKQSLGLTQDLPPQQVTGTLAPSQTRTLSYQLKTTTSIEYVDSFGDLCLCQAGIYPVDLSVSAVDATTAASIDLGWAQTYLPSITSTSHVQVSWLWPLIDQPHRLTDDNVFTDDELAVSVAPGGRLDRALAVLEDLARPTTVATLATVTLAIDPELIDELVVMTKGYRVQTAKGLVAGTGGLDARSWLSRLEQVLPQVGEVTLTPYADPDVDAVTRAGLSWSSGMPAAMQTRVRTVLGPLGDTAIAWPPGETVTPAALKQLAERGASTVVLNDATLPGDSDATPPPDAVSTIAGEPSVRAVVTSETLDKRVDAAINSNGTGLASLPGLIAELAIRLVEDSEDSHYVVLLPDRHVDTDPAAAAAAIAATTSASWATPISISKAVATIPPADHGDLTEPAGAQQAEIPAQQLSAVNASGSFVTSFGSAISPGASVILLGGFPAGIQRAESAAWRTDRAGGARFATELSAKAASFANGVQIVLPKNGSYTLASSDSSLIVTVNNSLPVPVSVKVKISTIGGVAGLTTDDAGVQQIPANNRRTIQIQAHVARTGHFRAQAELTTPDGSALGRQQSLSINSTALGTVGVVITIGASIVLIIALVIRFTRRLRLRRAASEVVQ